MKKTYKLIAVLLAVIICLFSTFTASAEFGSHSLTKEQWQKVYDEKITENTLPTLCVGADETELNLCWHADKDTAEARVLVSKNSDMTEAIEFTGEITPAENDEQVVCRVTVRGIEENSTYYYKWYSDNGWSDAYKYESKSFDSFKMLVVGDIQIGGQSYDNPEEQSRIGYVWQSLLDEALTKNPDISFLLSPGDNTSTGEGADEWQTLLMPEYLRSLPMALAIGNHDKKGMMYDYYTHMPNEFFGKYFEGLDRDFWFRYGDVLYQLRTYGMIRPLGVDTAGEYPIYAWYNSAGVAVFSNYKNSTCTEAYDQSFVKGVYSLGTGYYNIADGYTLDENGTRKMELLIEKLNNQTINWYYYFNTGIYLVAA